MAKNSCLTGLDIGNWRVGLSQCMLSISNVSMNNNQPWANRGNFEASTFCFEVILKRLNNSYGNVHLTKNTLKCHRIMKRFSKFHNNLKNSLITASVWPYRNIILTLYITNRQGKVAVYLA